LKELSQNLRDNLDAIAEERQPRPRPRRELPVLDEEEKKEEVKMQVDDFRSHEVCPILEDLTQPNPFLRPIILRDAFDDLDHYLDVNFRLLKEDFCFELR